MRRILLPILATLISGAQVTAQTAFAEVAGISAKEFKKTAINMAPPKGDKKGQSGPYWLAYNGQVPKRVALVSFYVFDKPFEETRTDTHQEYTLGSSGVGLYDVTTTTRITKNLTKDGASTIATDFFVQCKDSLVKAYADGEIQLLMPSEFAATPEKWKIYEDFEPDISGVFKGMLTRATNMSAVAEGFRFIPAPTDLPADYKFQMSMGQLAVDLGVDAVLIVTNKCQSTKGKGYEFTELHQNMYATNPVPKVEGQMYPGRAYCTGLLLDSWNYYGNYTFLTVGKKGELLGKDYTGYEVFVARLARLMTAALHEKVKVE